MRGFRRLLGVLALAAAGCASLPADQPTTAAGSAPGQQTAPQGLLGRWEGAYSNRYAFNHFYLNIKDVANDGRVSGTAYMRGDCADCNRDLAVTGMVSGPDGEETIELVFGDAIKASFTRHEIVLEGSGGPFDQTYRLARVIR